jgi:hypothetical protein
MYFLSSPLRYRRFAHNDNGIPAVLLLAKEAVSTLSRGLVGPKRDPSCLGNGDVQKASKSSVRVAAHILEDGEGRGICSPFPPQCRGT